MLFSLVTRARQRLHRTAARTLVRRVCRMSNPEPLVTFSFDDFPATAWNVGAPLLADHGMAATYFLAFGLLGQDSPSGRIVAPAELEGFRGTEHELGCHTHSHRHAFTTPAHDYAADLAVNATALQSWQPGARFLSHSYPISFPALAVKRACARRFLGCRGGGQTFNAGQVDLNQISAVFLEQCAGNLATITELLEANRRACGWLVFATHDIADRPSRFGVTPKFFASVLQAVAHSSCRVLTFAAALQRIGAASALPGPGTQPATDTGPHPSASTSALAP